MKLFRHMLRLTYKEGGTSIDARLVGHLENLNAVSANRQQEWIRNALRNAFIQEELILMGNSIEAVKHEGGQSEV